jgi:AcrR family transcriptional regulator
MTRVHAVSQPRAARTAERLASAALALMSERPLSEVGVAEIAARAGSSVGAFYARFACKEALLDWLCEHRLVATWESVLDRMERLGGSGADLEAVVDAYVAAALRFFSDNAVVLREVVRLGQAPGGTALLPVTLRSSRAADRTFLRILMERSGCSEDAVSLVPAFLAGMLRMYVLFPDTLPPEEVRRSRASLRRELSTWVLARLAGSGGRRR